MIATKTKPPGSTASCYTDPATLPKDIQRKLLAIRAALIADDLQEAYHVIYSIADPNFEKYEPWQALEEGSV